MQTGTWMSAVAQTEIIEIRAVCFEKWLHLEGNTKGIWGIQQYPPIFSRMGTSGGLEKLWVAGLLKYDDLKRIGWEWQSIDGCMVKALLAQEAVGHNPTDRGKAELID